MVSIVEHVGSAPPLIDALLLESEQAGFKFVRRLVSEWRSGINRFDAEGEVLLLAREHDLVIGIGGLNVDPYAGRPEIGRLRHVYVASDWRRRGIGRLIVRRLVDLAAARFSEVRLRTNTIAGDAFYHSLGFKSCSDKNAASHYFLV